MMNVTVTDKYKMTDVTDTLQKFKSKYVDKFDIEQAPRTEVKHYPLDDISSDNPFEIKKKLDLMCECQWSCFNHYVLEAIKVVYPDENPFDILKLDCKIGRIKIAPPNKFLHVGTKVDTLKLFGFTYVSDTQDQVRLQTELNYSIEIYELDLESQKA